MAGLELVVINDGAEEVFDCTDINVVLNLRSINYANITVYSIDEDYLDNYCLLRFGGRNFFWGVITDIKEESHLKYTVTINELLVELSKRYTRNEYLSEDNPFYWVLHETDELWYQVYIILDEGSDWELAFPGPMVTTKQQYVLYNYTTCLTALDHLVRKVNNLDYWAYAIPSTSGFTKEVCLGDIKNGVYGEVSGKTTHRVNHLVDSLPPVSEINVEYYKNYGNVDKIMVISPNHAFSGTYPDTEFNPEDNMLVFQYETVASDADAEAIAEQLYTAIATKVTRLELIFNSLTVVDNDNKVFQEGDRIEIPGYESSYCIYDVSHNNDKTIIGINGTINDIYTPTQANLHDGGTSDASEGIGTVISRSGNTGVVEMPEGYTVNVTFVGD